MSIATYTVILVIRILVLIVIRPTTVPAGNLNIYIETTVDVKKVLATVTE